MEGAAPSGTRHDPSIGSAERRAIVEGNTRWTASVAGVTFLAFALMHWTPAGSGLPSQIFGNLVPGLGLGAFAFLLWTRPGRLLHPNATLAGVFLVILAGDAYLTWTDHSAISLNVALFVMLIAGALLLSVPWLVVVLAVASLEGFFVSTLVPGGHPPSQAMLEAAAFLLALTIHHGRMRQQARTEALLQQESTRRIDLEKALAAREDSEARVRHLADAAFEGLVVHEHGAILECNQAAARMLGYRADELRGKHAFDIIAPGDHHLLRADLREPSAMPYEARALRRDGSTFPVEIAGHALPYDGRSVRVAAIRDLTERHQAQQAADEQKVARRIVRRALDMHPRADATLLAQRRRMGRSIAEETGAPSLDQHLRTFTNMGLGELRLVGQEGERFTFAGHDMLDRTPGARMPSCAVALGYIEGMLSQLTGHDVLGAELTCESQGHPECRFVAMPKAGAHEPLPRGAPDAP